MIGSMRSCSSRMRPSSTPATMPTSEPVTKPTSTRTMEIETSARISPLSTMGMAVRITARGGGMRNGLNTKVDRNCQTRNAIASDATISSGERRWPFAIKPRRPCSFTPPHDGVTAELSGMFTTVLAVPSMHPTRLVGAGKVGRQQGLDVVEQMRDLAVGQIAWARQLDVDHPGDHRARPDRHDADAVGERDC